MSGTDHRLVWSVLLQITTVDFGHGVHEPWPTINLRISPFMGHNACRPV